MRDAEDAHGILCEAGLGIGNAEHEVAICVCCMKQGVAEGAAACPHPGGRKKGPCPDYVLDEANPEETEARVLRYLRVVPRSD